MQRRWVISDIHGCETSLISLVEDKLQPTYEDEIFFLGDYIDRGPNPKGVLDYIMELQEAGYQVHCLMGNHEEVFLRCLCFENNPMKQMGFFELKDSWYFHGGGATMKSFGVDRLSQIPEKYIQFIRNLDFYKISGDFVLVHAGMNFLIADPFTDKLAMMWAKNYAVQPEKINHRRIIHGHVPQTLTQIQQSLASAPAVSIDNGCVFHKKEGMGKLLALDLNTFELVSQANVDLGERTEKYFRMVA
jgi:serine/threonine protein phosphatase 1